MSNGRFKDFEFIPPAMLKRLLSGFIWEGSPDSGSMALTFDDGPDQEVTPATLDTLEEIGARATFFLIGDRARDHSAIVRSITERGHLIGNHTMSHPKLLLMKRSKVEQEIDDAQKLLSDISGAKPTYFRPPYGMVDFTSARVIRDRELDITLWTMLSGDYSDISEETILTRVNPFIRAGAILVFHDTMRGGGTALVDILKIIGGVARERGVRLGGVDELSVSDEIALGKEYDE